MMPSAFDQNIKSLRHVRKNEITPSLAKLSWAWDHHVAATSFPDSRHRKFALLYDDFSWESMQIASASRAEALHIYTVYCPAFFFETCNFSASQSSCIFRQAYCRYLWCDGPFDPTWPSAVHISQVVTHTLLHEPVLMAHKRQVTRLALMPGLSHLLCVASCRCGSSSGASPCYRSL